MTLFIRVINNYMTHTNKIIYTRPSADISLHTPTEEYTAKVNEYFDSGKIVQKPEKVEDGLTTTWTIVFKDTDSYLDFKEELIVKNNHVVREDHCTEYSISYDLQSGV